MIPATAEEIAGMLFSIHKHAGMLAKFELDEKEVLVDADQIIYREKDILKLLEALGYPAPKWGGEPLTIEEFIKKHKK